MATPPPAAEQPRPIRRPARPHDRRVRRPSAPHYPPTVSDVLDAEKYKRDVDRSVRHGKTGESCTRRDVYNAILYRHSVVSQAAEAAHPPLEDAPPPWFVPIVQGLLNTLRDDIHEEFKKMRGESPKACPDRGDLHPLDVVPFATYHLPPLISGQHIDELDPEIEVVNQLRKDALKREVGAATS
ncbi:hypothetical protein EI94DRAFT_1748247 [Lactarius quietus]|nr:hypothetical protein EI94DRAFT_1748247 [Lactarius quietus]